MRRLVLLALLGACARDEPAERYGFVARLGRDTVSVENVTRTGNTMTSDAVDRFPRVRLRHAEIRLRDDGGIEHLEMTVRTPSEPEKQRERRIVADVTRDSVIITKRDDSATTRWAFANGGAMSLAHVPQLYSLYELYFAAARRRAAAAGHGAGDTVMFRQFYIDREFDRFPLHHAVVRLLPGDKAEISHDWLSGTGEATLDSAGRLLRYSGARTTYLVDVVRVDSVPGMPAIGERFATTESQQGGFRALSVRDTMRATIGSASFTVDYSRPLARGRTLVGDVIPYDRVWRTGANAATQLTTSAPVTLAGLVVPAGSYTLWTVPRATGVELVVNRQTGQWGTGYDRSRDLGRVRMEIDTLAQPVEQFTISIAGTDARRGTLAMEWGTFRWTAPIVVR
ncbi:MAG TPA: DUF2911 domain-containing protein [Gemmatimonadaceae bacterium]|nr:DUF2911 domain-containing protein [Gemmatimonadaceae bacterium]